MTLTKLREHLLKTDLPVAYHHFTKKQTPPFIVYGATNNTDFMADNEHYMEVINGYIELYTTIKDFDIENKVKQAIENSGVTYEKVNDTYIDDEEVFCVRWEIQFIDGGNKDE